MFHILRSFPSTLDYVLIVAYALLDPYHAKIHHQKNIKLLKNDGWFIARIPKDHCHFEHTLKLGIITAPHPKIFSRTLSNVSKQAEKYEVTDFSPHMVTFSDNMSDSTLC